MSESEDKDHIEELQKLVTAKEDYIKELLADKDNRNADLLHRLEREREACAEDRRDLTALVQELQARLTAKEHELEDSCALIKRQDEKLTAYETTIRELRCSLDKPERHMEVDPEKKIEEVHPAEHDRTISEKITNLFKREPVQLDYPVSESYEGPLSDLNKYGEIPEDPLKHHVEAYHHGWYEHLPVATKLPHPQESQKEPGISIVDKFGSLFKKKEAHQYQR